MEGWGWQSVHDPKVLPSVLKVWKKSIKTGQKFEMIFPLKGGDGKFCSFLTRVIPVKNEQGKIVNWFGTNTDITEQQKISEAIKSSEERFRTLIEQSTDAIQLVNQQGEILYSSESLKNVLGYTPDELSGAGVTPFLHPDDVEYFYKKFGEIIASPLKPILLHYRVRHKDGTWAWLETTGVNHLETPHINALVGTFRNITERKNNEEDLEYQKSLLEALQDVSPLGIVVVSAKGNVLTYNKLFGEMWKFPKKMLDKQIDEILLKAAQQQLEKPEEFIERVTYLYKHKQASHEKLHFIDGRIFDRYGSPIIGEGGIYYGYVWYFLDITERENLTKQKDDFLAIASHELKTPLTSVKAYTQMLERRFIKSNDMPSANLVSKMDTQLNKLNGLIGDLLDVTKIESGKLLFNEGYFNFNELVSEVIEEVQRTSETYTITKKFEKAQKVYGDKDRIGQVITNLLTNAMKYSPQSNKIVVSVSSTKKDVTLAVKDFGVGISKEKQEKVFERFYRVSGPKYNTFPGLGLGLYISSEIIKRQGGKIWVESRIGKGSTFYFTLPKNRSKYLRKSN